jgi:nitrate/TMAO reductase-like tetraheme cytochrome c subunit
VVVLAGAAGRADAGQKGKAPEPPANDLCLACHGDPGATRGNGTPMAVDEKKFGASIHGSLGFTCVTCHTDLAKTQDFPHAEKLAPVKCAACHDGAAAAFEKSIHASARRESAGSVAATCVDCHTKHEIRSAKDPESRTYPLNLPATCGRCHGDAKIIKQGNIRIGNVLTLYEDSIHGKAISRSGLLVAANCTSCHGNHDIRKKTDAGSRVFRANIPSVCGSCHEGIKTLYDQGAHGAALAKGQTNGPVCIDCHTAHNIQRIDVTSWRLDVIRECGTCHADKIKTYRDTFHGQVTSLGFVRVATCSDCHGAHDVHPQSDPRSTISDGRRLATCQKCHPEATASFAKYDPHADKHDAARDPFLYYAAIFMKWLLIGTFSFFGIHALAWLPRGFAARRQPKAQHAKQVEPAEPVEPIEPAEPIEPVGPVDPPEPRQQ